MTTVSVKAMLSAVVRRKVPWRVTESLRVRESEAVRDFTPEMTEAFIEEGFLSYADLYLTLEAPQLAEMSGLTEEQADEMLAYAEEHAERVEEEARLAKEEEAARAAPPPLKPTAAERAAELLPGEDVPAVVEPKPTIESLFGPDVDAKPEVESLSAAQVFGETSAEPPAEEPPEESMTNDQTPMTKE